MKHVICYSGGHSSAICAIECVRKYGKESVVLLNHNISSKVESQDVKRFKDEVADYLGLPITYANHDNWEQATPISVCVDAKAWKVGNGQILCTNRLKTAPFKKWLADNDKDKSGFYVYGFDLNEPTRITRRSQIMGTDGYKTEFPMLWKERTINHVIEVGIKPPNEYEKFKHANCIGCLKAGWQHWYIVFLERQDIWEEAKQAEKFIGYALHKDNNGPVYLEDKEALFNSMKLAGVVGTELISPARFWTDAKKAAAIYNETKTAELANIPLRQLDMFAEHDNGVCSDCIA